MAYPRPTIPAPTMERKATPTYPPQGAELYPFTSCPLASLIKSTGTRNGCSTAPIITDPTSVRFDFAAMTVSMQGTREGKAGRERERARQYVRGSTEPMGYSKVLKYSADYPHTELRGKPVHWYAFTRWMQAQGAWDEFKELWSKQNHAVKLRVWKNHTNVVVEAGILWPLPRVTHWQLLNQQWQEHCASNYDPI